MGMNSNIPDCENHDVVETFDRLDIPNDVLRGIYSSGFEKPSVIQQRGIKPTILGRDVIAQAPVGTVSIYILMFAQATVLISQAPFNTKHLLCHLLTAYPLT